MKRASLVLSVRLSGFRHCGNWTRDSGWPTGFVETQHIASTRAKRIPRFCNINSIIIVDKFVIDYLPVHSKGCGDEKKDMIISLRRLYRKLDFVFFVIFHPAASFSLRLKYYLWPPCNQVQSVLLLKKNHWIFAVFLFGQV